MQSALQKVDKRTLRHQSSSDALCDGHVPFRLEALGMMTAGIVHDLGNIIQILSSTVELLDRHPDVKATTSLQPPMRRAVSSVGRASALIAQILRFARGATAEHESVDLKQCLMDLKPLLRWIGKNRMRLDIHVDANTPPVVCNRSDLENAILNLAVNARDAMSERGALSITAVPRRKGRIVTEVAVSVSDTGHGMSSQTMARALEPFFTTKAALGNGLGLTMVRRFAQEAGGDVTLESGPGLGTTVTLLLPVQRRPAER
jgi:signal transduction histidine kinase